ncbi:MAG TPA: TonB-dependent receptor plug domain-containing protein [Nitrospira sp.]|nr:TonB-dependent receptor plug domain-containing protein [Nitrospira sp.]HMV55871.1 TonB-dependent receptor plug domain-containing protein [Nitrospira sp.]HMX91067.1 TonB-dependent receptor plug domain-containing protein [Nitrospira sp.]HNE33055.1 TonB-dependent receptor plug domain-containing protein [Nitrospira sp.]HNG03321.1 TonB-dependent receptor plug domain-containing protein [Nitrospira sp.]
MTGALRYVVLWLALILWAAPLHAHDPDAVDLELPEVEVSADRPVAASSQQFIPDKEYLMQPQGRPAQVLRLIPGFIAVEHSGGAGKADQYFLRGFDADHGTDVAFFTDGMPINLRSHAHGQGYTDLNFIIPETIEGVDVYKGAYLPEYGDFATAGAVNFRTRDMVKEGVVQSAGGQFNTQRHLLMFSPTKDTVRTLFAAEGYYTDGPFQNDNRYFRGNLLGKATMNPLGRDELVITGTFQKSQWNGSGEIPLRAVHDGSLDRFGSIDPSEGGKTLRSTGRMNYHYDMPSGGRFFANAYAQYYRFDLFTNFTFFLNDPVNGDGFQQSDRRVVYGGDVGYRHSGHLFDMDGAATVGVQARIDDIHARLAPQVKRAPLGSTADSTIFEASYAPFLKLELQPTPWLRLAGGVRTEVFTFDVRNRCANCAEQPFGNTSTGLVLPKMNVILGPWFETEFFANYGEGYHSNDARSIVARAASPLAKARNYEVGVRSKPWGPDGVELIGTLWALDLKQELVFVGDAGTTEIRGASRRRGLEVAARGQVWGPLYFNGSVTWTKAEFTNGDAIPLAPEVTAYGALLLRWPEGLTSQLQATYLGVRPLVEDRSAKAPSWTTFDLSERYQLPVKLPHGRLEAFLFVQNLFNTKWEQATFFFDSRLRNEAAGVADTHFVPGSPRFVMAGLAWYF